MELNLLFEGNNDGGCKINELQQTTNKLIKNKDFINNIILYSLNSKDILYRNIK
jgi:hypothetical protein